MAWWSLKDKFRRNKNNGNNNVASHVQKKNEVASEYSKAMTRLKTNDLTDDERMLDLITTYREGRDVIVVPATWKEHILVRTCGKKVIFVETLHRPTIVRTR